MSVTITKRPDLTIGSDTSKFTAAQNPVLYRAQRRDYEVTEIQQASGDIRIDVGSDITSELTNGDTLYLQTNDFDEDYDQQVTIASSTWTGSETQITCNEAYIVGSTGTTANSFINLLTDRPEYYLEVKLINPDTSTAIVDEALNFTPSIKGVFDNIDVGIIVRSFLGPTGSTESTKEFYLQYTEKWTGSGESAANDSSNEIIATHAARQIGDTYGANLFTYVPWPDYTPLSEILGGTRVLFAGQPFGVSSLTNEDMRPLLAEFTFKDATGSTISQGGAMLVGGENSIASGELGVSVPTDTVTADLRVIESSEETDAISGTQASAYMVNSTTGWVVKNALSFVKKTTDGGDTWNLQTTTATNDLANDVFAWDENTAWIATATAAEVLQTTDGGTTWNTRIPAGAGANNSVHFASALIGWICGDSGKVEKSTDGGVNWVAQTAAGSANMNGIYAIDTSTVLMVGDSGTIEKTTDGGTTWTDKSPTGADALNDITFFDDLIGYVAGDDSEIWITKDAGENWTRKNINAATGSTNIAAILQIDVDRSTGYIYATAQNTRWVISKDQGDTWALMSYSDTAADDAFGLSVVNEGHIILAGQHIWSIKPGQGSAVSNTVALEVRHDAVNPVTLRWVNSLGGWSYWTFENSQLTLPRFGKDKTKRNRQTLFTSGLTRAQWDALNELNTLGEVTGLSVQDLINDTRDRQRSGAQVYAIENGTETPVIVTPSANRFNSKFVYTDFSIQIEYPEIYQLA